MNDAIEIDLARERRKVTSLAAELVARYDELHLLHSLGPLIGCLTENDQIAALALGEVCEILHADCGWVAFCDGTGWRLPESCCVMINFSTANHISREVLGPLRLRGQSQVISHALTEEYRIDDPCAPVRFLACPLRAGENSLGCICLGRRQDAPIFTSSDQKLLYAAASLTGMTLENLRLQLSDIEKKRLAAELELAAQIQRSLLPRDLDCGSFMEASGVSLPCFEVGGDYFDLFPLHPDLCLFAIADVSGKGPPAALQASMVHGIFHAAARHSKEVSDLMRTANQCIRERGANNRFVTAFLATLDNDGRLQYSNAGHNPPLWIQSGGRVTELAEGNLPLGILENASYPEATVQLERGDVLVLHTDGLTDAENVHGETFGAERVLEWAGGQWQRTAAEVKESLLEAVRGFSDGQRQADDLTLLIICFRGDRT